MVACQLAATNFATSCSCQRGMLAHATVMFDPSRKGTFSENKNKKQKLEPSSGRKVGQFSTIRTKTNGTASDSQTLSGVPIFSILLEMLKRRNPLDRFLDTCSVDTRQTQSGFQAETRKLASVCCRFRLVATETRSSQTLHQPPTALSKKPPQ